MEGSNIASERARLRLSQAELAGLLGVAVNSLSNWERGEFEPTASKVREMARIFGCSADYLLGLTDERVRR